MRPSPGAAQWEIPAIESPGDLSKWLGIAPDKLRWFADLKGLTAKVGAPRLNHYHYRVLAKAHNHLRLIEAPKPELKQLQRKILAGILEKIPIHPAAHGFVRGRSIKTFVHPHAGKRVILRMDLQDFFPSLTGTRIQAMFRAFGYPESAADLLGGICTNAAPRGLWIAQQLQVDSARMREARDLYSRPHLPQGAPTSPALANLSMYRVDCRLSGLADSVGGVYTRYADDLAFSGDETFERVVDRFSTHVAAILMEEGFQVHFRKTRVMRKGVRQHLAGLIVNRHENLARRDFDVLKAMLTNCVRFGPESQNRDGLPHLRSHVEGRLAFAESINPQKAARLRRIFNRIRWEE
jgi:hypothetical protein